jgi:hypothetical protein
MTTAEIVAATGVACFLLIVILAGTYELGKQMMRQEITVYGCEQAMKAYKATP